MRQRVEWQINRKQMKINIKPGSEGERRRDWKQVSGVMRHSRGGGRMCDVLTVHLGKTTHFYSLLQPSALLRHQLLSKVEGKLEKIYSISASVVISSRKWNLKRDSLCCNFFLKPCQVTKPLTHHNLQMYIHLSLSAAVVSRTMISALLIFYATVFPVLVSFWQDPICW